MPKHITRKGPATNQDDIVELLRVPKKYKDDVIPRIEQGHLIQDVWNDKLRISVRELCEKSGCSLQRVLNHVNFQINDRKRAMLIKPSTPPFKGLTGKRKIKQVVRTCVTIPAEIRSRMITFQHNHVVNWSEVACAAFVEYMNELEETAVPKSR